MAAGSATQESQMSVYSPLFAATLLAAVVGVAPAPAEAQPASDQQPRIEQRTERPSPGRFIEGRLAFLRTELKLTEAQQPLFEKLADEMRASAKAMEARHAVRHQKGKARAKPVSAVEKMERRNAMMKQASAAGDRFLEAFKPFYASLSDEQKKTADLLFARHGGGRQHHH
jgi:protein CpxP